MDRYLVQIGNVGNSAPAIANNVWEREARQHEGASRPPLRTASPLGVRIRVELDVFPAPAPAVPAPVPAPVPAASSPIFDESDAEDEGKPGYGFSRLNETYKALVVKKLLDERNGKRASPREVKEFFDYNFPVIGSSLTEEGLRLKRKRLLKPRPSSNKRLGRPPVLPPEHRAAMGRLLQSLGEHGAPMNQCWLKCTVQILKCTHADFCCTFKKNCTFPLFPLAKMLFAIPATSADNERSFSSASFTLDSRRYRTDIVRFRSEHRIRRFIVAGTNQHTQEGRELRIGRVRRLLQRFASIIAEQRED
jgi:hypothetical protein